MDKSNDLLNFIEFYKSAAKFASREPIPDLIGENGKFRAISLPCPMCSSGEDDNNERTNFGEHMLFNFEELTFRCDECDAEFTADEILEELKTKVTALVNEVEGFALLLPKLELKSE